MSATKRYVLVKVAAISAICTVAFTFRAAGDIATIIWGQMFADSWWINGVFFVALEIIPFMLILYILHANELPRRATTGTDSMGSVENGGPLYTRYSSPIMYVSTESISEGDSV